MDKKQIEGILREIIAKRLQHVKQETITIDTDLADLGLDSLDLSWVLVDMEEAFEFTISISDMARLKTIAEVVDFVERQVAG